MNNSVEVIANHPGLVLAVRMGNVVTVCTSICIGFKDPVLADVNAYLDAGDWITETADRIRDKGLMFGAGWVVVYHHRDAHEQD